MAAPLDDNTFHGHSNNYIASTYYYGTILHYMFRSIIATITRSPTMMSLKNLGSARLSLRQTDADRMILLGPYRDGKKGM